MKKIYKFLIVILLVLFTFFFVNNNNYFEKIKIKGYALDTLSIFDKFLDIRNYKKYVTENKELKEREMLDETLILKSKEQEQEILSLKELLDIKKVYSSYDVVFSTVIMENVISSSFTIDKGKSSSIKKGDAVITNDGILGIVDVLYDNSAVVKLLSTKNTNLSIKVNDIYGALSYDHDNIFVINDIKTSFEVKIGDKVYTTGMGNLPSGILVGTVKEIKEDNYGISNILFVEGAYFNNTRYVGVLRSK